MVMVERLHRRAISLTSGRERGNDHGTSGSKGTDQIAIGIHYKGFAQKFCFPGGNLHIVHSMGNCGSHAVGHCSGEIQMGFQPGRDLAGFKIACQEPENLHGGNENAAILVALHHAVQQISPDKFPDISVQLLYVHFLFFVGMAGKNLDDGRMVAVELLKLNTDQNLIDETPQVLVSDKGTAVGNSHFLQLGDNTAVLTKNQIDPAFLPQLPDFPENQFFNPA